MKTTSFAAAGAPGAISCPGHQSEAQAEVAALGVVQESLEVLGSHGSVAAHLAR